MDYLFGVTTQLTSCAVKSWKQGPAAWKIAVRPYLALGGVVVQV